MRLQNYKTDLNKNEGRVVEVSCIIIVTLPGGTIGIQTRFLSTSSCDT